MYKDSSCSNTERQTDRHTHAFTYTQSPFRTRAYTDIKGPLFSPSYRYSTGGLCCEHIYVRVFMSASVCETTIYGVNSCRHPRHPELIVTRVCARVHHCGLFFVNNWETTAVPPTMFREAEQSGLWRHLFVVVEREEMRSCWRLWLGAIRAYRRAGPGREENTNHLLASLAVLMEMRNSSFSALYQSNVECVVTPGRAISLLLQSLPFFSLLHSLHVTMCYCETVHAKDMTNHLSQQNSSSPRT